MSFDPEELRDLVNRHAAGLTLYARRFCREPEDAAQLALAKLALLSAAPADPAAWLYTVCRREALQLARSERRRKARESRPSRTWFAPSVDEGVDAEAVRAACERLPAAESEAVALHLWGGLTFAQVGVVTGVSAATAYRRYAAGLDRLRNWLGDLR